ncbi:acyltransferase [Anaerovorax odorimutans]|uniref:acyltransferase n=1 Tax=Anaerovorax odorimutans TaxID=109327 RepID=UPI0003FA972F|nr:acyltransferase [Anaerovorax odorimutans]
MVVKKLLVKKNDNAMEDHKNAHKNLYSQEELHNTEGNLLVDKKSYYVHNSSYIDENVKIGEGTKIWHFCHVQKNTEIGTNCSIGQNVNIALNVKIGNNVKIQNNVSIYEGVELEDYVFCGPSSVFTNVKFPRSKYPQKGTEFYAKTLVKEGASLGANCTIVCGNTIGKHAFIAAGSVVVSDVPDYGFMIGVPAKRKGWICECGNKLDDEWKCNKCNKKYVESDGKLSEVLDYADE